MIKYLWRRLCSYSLEWYFFFLGCVYFILQWNRYFSIPPIISSYDDGLQYALSKSISAGHWLGSYYSNTLSKGLTFPIWTAFLHVHHIPLWLGDNILYFIACVALVYSISKLIFKKWVLVLLYGVLLFNPVILVRAYRDTIAPSLMLLILASAIGAFSLLTTKHKRSKIDIIIFTVIGIFSWPAWENLREDSFWVTPVLLLLILVGLFYYLRSLRWKIAKNFQEILLVLFLLLLPFAAEKIAVIKISSLNKQYYNRYVVNDFTSSDFTNAYAELTRVTSSKAKALTVPVSWGMRQKLYKAVPLFNKLEPCLDGQGGECENFEKYGVNANSIHDYQGGWFPWALRLAVQHEGYYKNASTANKYYLNLASEIKSACKNKKLMCHSIKSIDLTPLPTISTINPFLENLKDSSSFIIFLNQVSSPGSAAAAFRPYGSTSTNQTAIATYYGVRYSTKHQSLLGKTRYTILNLIARVYIVINPIIFCASLVALLSSTFPILKKKLPNEWRLLILCWVLLAAIMLRVALLAYVQTVSFPAITVNYFSSDYVVLFVFEILCILLVKKHIKQHLLLKNK